MPQFIRPASGAVAAQTLILGLIFLALAIVNDSMYALLAARLKASLDGNWVFAQRRRYLTGGIYLALGLGATTETHWHHAAHNLTYGAPLNDVPLARSVRWPRSPVAFSPSHPKEGQV